MTQPLRHARLWLGAGWLLVAAVTVVSLMPDDGQLDNVALYNDKAAHILAYFVLMIWFAGACPRERYGLIAVGLVTMGVGLELLQGVLGYRGMELADVAANVAGVATGWAVAVLGAGGWCRQVERLFAAD